MKPVFVNSLLTKGLFILIWFLVFSCNKHESVTPQQTANSQITAVNNNQIIDITKDVLDITQDGLSTEGLIESVYSSSQNARKSKGCRPTVTSKYTDITRRGDSITYSGTLTIDYGDGTTCTDSVKVRKGKVIDKFMITIVGKHQGGTKPAISYEESITFQSFQKDSNQINGTFVTQSTGGVTIVTTEDATITYPDGTSTTWNGALTYTYINNETIKDRSDDSQTIMGSVSGTNRQGDTYTATITKPITYTISCQSEDINGPVEGVVEITSGGTSSITDYGSGTCDNKYTITLNGVSTEYTF